MKVLDANVLTLASTFVPHTLQILVDKIPVAHELEYDVIDHDDGSASYFLNEGGYVNFFHHQPRNEQGYGGASWTVRLKDGSSRVVKGPWSSNSAAMEEMFGVPSMPVSITDDPEVFARGYTFYSGHITEWKVREAVTLLPSEWVVFKVGDPAQDKDLSAGQHGIVYNDRLLHGFYLARRNCPTAFTSRNGEKVEGYCLNAWHQSWHLPTP